MMNGSHMSTQPLTAAVAAAMENSNPQVGSGNEQDLTKFAVVHGAGINPVSMPHLHAFNNHWTAMTGNNGMDKSQYCKPSMNSFWSGSHPFASISGTLSDGTFQSGSHFDDSLI